MAQDAKKYRVVDNFSSFPYGNYLQHLKKIVQPGCFPTHNRTNEERECKTFVFESSVTNSYQDGYHQGGSSPENIICDSLVQYSTLFMKSLLFE